MSTFIPLLHTEECLSTVSHDKKNKKASLIYTTNTFMLDPVRAATTVPAAGMPVQSFN